MPTRGQRRIQFLYFLLFYSKFLVDHYTQQQQQQQQQGIKTKTNQHQIHSIRDSGSSLAEMYATSVEKHYLYL